MNVEIWTEAAKVPVKEHINRIFVAVQISEKQKEKKFCSQWKGFVSLSRIVALQEIKTIISTTSHKDKDQLIPRSTPLNLRGQKSLTLYKMSVFRS
jgi:hypothetical protein